MRCSLALGNDRDFPSLQVLLKVLTSMSRTVTDPLVHHGRHFGRVVHTFCNVNVLITNGLTRMGESEPVDIESLTQK
jgi:hypothetical protein